MLKMQNKIIDSLLVCVLALGLGGCATSSVATHKTYHEPASTKIAKQNSHKKATTETKQENSSSQLPTNKEAKAITNNKLATNTPSQNATQSSSTNQQTSTTNQANNSVLATKNNPATQKQKDIQLGTNDLAVWTDQYGIVHHVDSNGLDHQTIPGSVQDHYENWSGALPSNAQVIHNAGPIIPNQSDKVQHNNGVQLGLGDVATWTDQYGITHHVDSDGMDRQTILGSTEVHYQDWSGPLPSNAEVSHE
ncbi:hypothetical protein [Limosilactobacillus vaginalis]|jgi:hypothetical protein|uniref:hypothetical protein n=1 Tax=Limosilactobacillus vaginalis TaxID=1633 RepID=UPI000BEF01D6|nr:hypothetical protein [Limosilactobacillus vaginalis]PEH03706.1 hypothetical protein CP356_08665 [Lactobacillus sp. UMNPBX5]